MQGLWEATLEEEREKGLKKGIRKGRQEGIEKGIEKGRREGLEQAALQMLRKGTDLEEVADTLGLPIQKLQKLKV